jgi:intracellular sulfur oxidation DsrE/DsrF family protein
MDIMLLALLLGAVAPAAKPESAAKKIYPLIQGYGGIVPQAHAVGPEKILKYRVVFSITQPAPAPDAVTPGLEQVARFMNVCAYAGVDAVDQDLIAVFRGTAVRSALRNDAFRRRFYTGNPDLELLMRLDARGVKFFACGQALSEEDFSSRDTLAFFSIAQSGTVFTATCQLQGYVPVL